MPADANRLHRFSVQHLEAARYFSRRAVEVESRSNVGEIDKSEHRAYVTGALVFSTAFLESSINEFYLDAVLRDVSYLSGLECHLNYLTERWPHIERSSVLDKYDDALRICAAEKFEKAARTHQDAAALIKLRNALMHYKPESEDNLDVHDDLRVRLKDRFKPNPLVAHDSLWFPHLCLGSECGQWGVRTAEEFMTEFCRKLKVRNRLSF
jgi:hypothetical protein